MIPLIETAQEVQTFLQEQNWRFCFIGGLALQRWGQPRLTQDVDLTLLAGFGVEDDFIKPLLQKFTARRPDAEIFARQNRVLLLKTAAEIGIDISLGALPFEEDAINRASFYEYIPNISLLTCSAEDLIVMKAFADRLQDWADIEGVIIKQDKLDWHYIEQQLVPLIELKYAPEILTKLKTLRDKTA
jgi:hypothetical protein